MGNPPHVICAVGYLGGNTPIKEGLVMKYVTDYPGWLFCETAFTMERCWGSHMHWDEKKDRYAGVFGWVYCVVFDVLYRTGSWFYSRG